VRAVTADIVPQTESAEDEQRYLQYTNLYPQHTNPHSVAESNMRFPGPHCAARMRSRRSCLEVRARETLCKCARQLYSRMCLAREGTTCPRVATWCMVCDLHMARGVSSRSNRWTARTDLRTSAAAMPDDSRCWLCRLPHLGATTRWVHFGAVLDVHPSSPLMCSMREAQYAG
jgi:hypothetical protein